MKRLAVVVSGWHFPLHFYREIAAQQIPDGWSMDLFCVSHRDPKYSAADKQEYLLQLGWNYRDCLDRILYEKVATIAEIEALGWHYKEYPNTIGDWGNTNQWLESHSYKDYDMLLVSHDDNLLPTRSMLLDLLTKEGDWLILTNSTGSVPASRKEKFRRLWKPAITVRGSFEFIKPETLDLIGGMFDLSAVALTREGKTSGSIDIDEVREWNKTTHSMDTLFERKNMQRRLVALSSYYRVSKYCIEGERGFIGCTQPQNTASEEKGFRMLGRWYPHAR
jgi:hypothetical protein